MEALTTGEARGRWVLAATILGSAMALIDATAVNVALPAIEEDLGVGTAGLTWVVNAYTLTLASLILLGGSLGDRLGRRRVFVVGVAWFALASLACGLSQTTPQLVGARALQGVGGALLTPGSLAILQASFRADDRSRAIGYWSGFSGVAAVVGPLVGGWLVGLGSWRLVFLVNLPVAALVLVLARHVPESRDESASGRIDLPGVAWAVLGLGVLTYGLTERSAPLVLVGMIGLAAFVFHEARARNPMVPLGLFRSRTFSATNLVTFLVYAAIGGLALWLIVTLQVVSDFPAILAGMALLPLTVCMLFLSPVAGAVSQRIGPTIPMTVGPLVSALGVAALARIDSASHLFPDVLVPTTLFGLGLAATVTPLTSTVLSAVPDSRTGTASGVNNAVARTAGLLAVATLPLVSGLGPNGFSDPAKLEPAFHTVALVCSGLLVCGGLLSAAWVRRPDDHDRHPECPRMHCDVHGPPTATVDSVPTRT